MKSKVMCIAGLVMLVMLGILAMRGMERGSRSELLVVEGAGENCVAERLERSAGIRELVGWKEGIEVWRRRGRPYRNPLRRDRVSKKVRMQLRRSLAGLERKEQAREYMEGVIVGEDRAESGRWG